jgi:hypothetical protein
MDEQTFLTSPVATVTSSRIVINGKTFATRNVGSVSIATMVPSKTFPILMIIVGALCALGKAWEAAVIIGGLGILWLLLLKNTYRLMMMAGGGEVMAIESKNGSFINSIHDAVAQAISVR